MASIHVYTTKAVNGLYIFNVIDISIVEILGPNPMKSILYNSEPGPEKLFNPGFEHFVGVSIRERCFIFNGQLITIDKITTTYYNLVEYNNDSYRLIR